jgi:tetratricopeptide (TPR) repeat protein
MTDEQYNSAADDEATEQIHAVSNAGADVDVKRSEGFMTRLRALVTGSQASSTSTTERLVALTRAIERHPESAANYVLRGELFLDIGEKARAAQDFQAALRLTEAQFAEDDWGLVAQALQDRAIAGLERVKA